MKKYLASLFFIGSLLVQAAPYTFPTESLKPGSAGTPGQLDKEFQSLLGSGVQFIGKPDIRTAMIQTDGKILIGGTFRIAARGLKYFNYTTSDFVRFDESVRDYVLQPTQSISFTVVWRNLARLNANGTIDASFVSNSALDVAKSTLDLRNAQYRNSNPDKTTNEASLEYGPDGAVYSILLNQATGDPLYEYLVGGDFLNFSHNADGNSEPRKRYLLLKAVKADQINSGGLTQPLVALTDNVADGDGFNGPVRRLRRLQSSTVVQYDFIVPNRPARLANNLYPVGTVVLQSDSLQLYRRLSSRTGNAGEETDWLNLPNGREKLFLATGDFTSFSDDIDQRYITRFIFRDGGITLPAAIQITWVPPRPDGRVWDVANINNRIFFVGEFNTVDNKPNPLDIESGSADPDENRLFRYKIAAIDENGYTDPWFEPGKLGFNNTVMSIVADPEYKKGNQDSGQPSKLEDRLVVGGYFTDYEGKPVGYIARLLLKWSRALPPKPGELFAKDGDIDAEFPAANNGNRLGANGPIRVVTRQPDGRFFIAGEFTTYNGIKRAGLARLEPDGSLDLTFVPAGTASGIQNFAFDMDGGPGTASLFARPLAVGNFSKLFGSNFTGVARFIGGSFPVIWYQPNKINAPFAVSLGDDKALSVAASDNFVGYTGELGLPTGLEELPFESPQTPSEPLLYQWEKYKAGKWQEIQGEVLSYLMIENFKPEDATTYRVRIWNSQFSIYSETVNVGLRNPFTDKIPDTGLQVQGLIEANETLNGGLGGYISFTMTRTGMVTGTLTLGNVGGKPVKVSFLRQYNLATGLEVQIPLPNKSPLVLRLKTEDFSGTTSNATTSNDVDFSGSELTDSFGTTAAINASNVPWTKFISAKSFAGNYNIALQTDSDDLQELAGNQPLVSQGYGYLSMQVAAKTGVARVVGYLADGTAVTASSALQGEAFGTIALWLPLYNGQGVLSGKFNIDKDTDGKPVDADLKWTKPPGVKASPDVSGFSNVRVYEVPGSGLYDTSTAYKFDFDPTGAWSMDFNDGAWAALAGALSENIAQLFTFSRGKATPYGDNPHGVTFTLSPKTGLVKGGFTDADSQGRLRKVKYQAITLKPTSGNETLVYGFFIMPSAAVKNPDFYVGGSVEGNYPD